MRCRSYFRGRGVFIYHGIRCVLNAGHLAAGQRHEAPGRFLDPRTKHVWGRVKNA